MKYLVIGSVFSGLVVWAAIYGYWVLFVRRAQPADYLSFTPERRAMLVDAAHRESL